MLAVSDTELKLLILTMTRVLACSLQTPVVAPVSIGVCSYTAGASVGGPRLPPHPVVVPGVLVAVRVHAGHYENVVFEDMDQLHVEF